MAQDIKKYQSILESAYTSKTVLNETHDPARVAQLVRHVFGNAKIDKHTLKAALLGHKNDPSWAMEVLDHLSR